MTSPLFNAVTAVATGIDQLEGRYAVGQPFHGVAGIALLLGEIIYAVRDDQPQVAYAGLVDAWVINLVENSVAQREPDSASVAQGRAKSGLRTGSPARRDTGSAWRNMI